MHSSPAAHSPEYIIKLEGNALRVKRCHPLLQVLRPLQYRLEVYMTTSCGWGVRSWDTIYAGSFVCFMAGRIKRWACVGACPSSLATTLAVIGVSIGGGGRSVGASTRLWCVERGRGARLAATCASN